MAKRTGTIYAKGSNNSNKRWLYFSYIGRVTQAVNTVIAVQQSELCTDKIKKKANKTEEHLRELLQELRNHKI
jgi:hypothetical protein